MTKADQLQETFSKILENQSKMAADIAVIREKLSDYDQIKKDLTEIKIKIESERVKVTGIIAGLSFLFTAIFNGILYMVKK